MNPSTVDSDSDSAAADDCTPLAAAPAQAAVHLPAPSFEDDLPLTPLPSSPHTLGPGPGGSDAPFPCAPDQTIRPSDACAMDVGKASTISHNDHAALRVAPLDDPDAGEVDTNNVGNVTNGNDENDGGDDASDDADEDAPLLLAEFKEDASATVSPALVGTAALGRAAHPLDNEHDDDDDAGRMATSDFSGRFRGCAQLNDHDEPVRSTSPSMLRPHATWETASVESCGASRAEFTDANHSHSNPGIYGGGSAFGGLGFGGSVSGTCREETASVALDAGLEEGYEWVLEMFDPAFFTGTAVAGRRLRGDHDEPERSTSLSMLCPHATWETASVESCGASRAEFTDANHSHSNPGIHGGGSAFGGLGFGGSVSGTCREETASVALDAGLEEGYEWALEMFDPAFFTGTAVAGRRSGAAGRLSMLGLSSSRTPTQGGMGAGGLARPGSAALVPLTPPMSFARVGESSMPSLSLLGPHHQPTSSSTTHAPSMARAGHAERHLHQPPTLEAADALPAPAMPVSSDGDNAVSNLADGSSSGAFMLPEPRMAQRATASGPSSPASKRRSLERTRTARPSEFPAPLAAVSRQGSASFSEMRRNANHYGSCGSGGMMRGSQSNSFEEGDDEDQPIFFVEELQLVEMDREKGLTSPSTPPQLAETPKVAPAKSTLLASATGTSPPSWPAEHPQATTQGEAHLSEKAKHPHRTRTSPVSPIEEKPGQYVIVGPEVRRRALPPPSPTRVVTAQLSSSVAASTEGKGKHGLLPSVDDSSSIPMAMSRAPLPHQVDITSSTLLKPPAAKTTKNKRERDLEAKANTVCGVGSLQEQFTLPVSALSTSSEAVLEGSVAERVHRRRHTKPDPAETVVGFDKKSRRVTRKHDVTASKSSHHQSSNDNDDAHHDDAGAIAESTAAALEQSDSPYGESQVMTKSDSCGWIKSKLKRTRSDPGGPDDGDAASRVSHRLSRKDVSHPAFHWSRFSDSEESEASDSDHRHEGDSSFRHPSHETMRSAAVVASSHTHESRGMIKCERRPKFTTASSVQRPKNAPFAPVLCRFFSLPAPCDFPRPPFSGDPTNGPPGPHQAPTSSIVDGGDGGVGGGDERVSEFAPIEFMKGDAKRRKKVLEERKKAHLLAVQRAMALHTATCEETWDPVDNRCSARPPPPLAAVTSSKQTSSATGEAVPSHSRPAPQQTLPMPQQAPAGLTSPPLKEVRNFSELLAHLKQEKEEKASGCTPKVSPRLAPARPLLPLALNPLSDAMSPLPPIRSEKAAAVAMSSDSKKGDSHAPAFGSSDEPQQPRVSFVDEEASAGGPAHAPSSGSAAPVHDAHHHHIHSRPSCPKHHPQHQHQHHRRAVEQQQTLASVFPLVVCADVHQQALPVLHRPTPVRPRGLSRGANTEESHHRADVHHAFRRVDAAASRQTECTTSSQLKHLKPPVSGPGSQQHRTADGRVKSEGSTKSAASKRVQAKSKVASPAGPDAPPPGTPSSATVESRPPVVSPAIVDRGAFPSAHGSSSNRCADVRKMPGDGAVADAASQSKAPSERVKSQGRVGVLSPAGFSQSPGGGSVVSSPTAALFDESDFGLPRRRRKRDRGRCADDRQLQPHPPPPLDDASLTAGPKEKQEDAEKEKEKEKEKAKKEKKKKHRFHGDSKLKAGPFLLNP